MDRREAIIVGAAGCITALGIRKATSDRDDALADVAVEPRADPTFYRVNSFVVEIPDKMITEPSTRLHKVKFERIKKGDTVLKVEDSTIQMFIANSDPVDGIIDARLVTITFDSELMRLQFPTEELTKK